MQTFLFVNNKDSLPLSKNLFCEGAGGDDSLSILSLKYVELELRL